MNITLADLALDQRRFLAALEAFGGSVPLDLAKNVVAIGSSSLKEVLRQGRDLGWLDWTEDNQVGLTRNIPEPIKSGLRQINSPEHLSALIDGLYLAGPDLDPDRRAAISLLMAAGRPGEAAEVELDLAREFLKQRDHDQAYQHQGWAVEKLYRCIVNGQADKDRPYVEAVIELSSLSFAVGRGLQVLSSYLRTAVSLSESSGNVRSHALACLHLGRLLAYLDRPVEGLAALAAGKEEVELLGDADILKAAAEFLGLYYGLQGRFKEALVHFERAEQLFTREEDRLLVYPMILWALGLTLFATGQIPRALGFFKSYWQSARDLGLPAVASIARAILGFCLAVARKGTEAMFHLDASLQEGRENRYDYTLFIARVGLAVQLFHDGRLRASHEVCQSALSEGRKATSVLLYSKEYLLDMLAAFHHHGLGPVGDGWEYEKLLDSCLSNPSAVQQGAALRRRAADALEYGRPASEIVNDLNSGLDLLTRSGAALALNDAQITLARLHLREGEHEKAQSLVKKIKRQIRDMGLEPEYLPEDIRDLPTGAASRPEARDYVQDLIDGYLKVLHGLDAAVDEDELFHWGVRRIGRLIGSERGALFWKPDQNQGPQFELRAGYNITRREVSSQAFQPSLAHIRKAFKENQYIRTKPESPQYASPEERVRELLCLPIRVGSEVRGVLYYDYSYLRANFDFLPAQWTPILLHHTNVYFSHILELLRLREETNRLAANKSVELERLGRGPILAQAPAMLKMLEQAEKAARSEANLLITGETGTGKELLVGRLHQLSVRASGPFIVVDSAAMAENLVESELFGHEKGAFTGADMRKRGRIELAHEGTLFIDEIGELPLQVQVKLLRAIETKTFYRVGGARPVKSDFRLMAATNRRLADEVAAGRFRQDLYYRLNVIAMVLPPLRERGDDVILLARHFLRHYGAKYGRRKLELTGPDEERLLAYSWPGNIRELKNLIERAVILSSGERLILDLPSGAAIPRPAFTDSPTMDELQRRYITHVLEKTGGRIYGPQGAAEILGMKRSTLYKRMDKLGLRKT